MSFDRILTIFKSFVGLYELDPKLIPLIKKVNEIRNNLAHPVKSNLEKYTTNKTLHQAYTDLVKGISVFKTAVEKIKKISTL